jgi:hypothetical protein
MCSRHLEFAPPHIERNEAAPLPPDVEIRVEIGGSKK